MIRNWLCSAFRVGQPQGPVPGVEPSPVANRRILFRPPWQGGQCRYEDQRLTVWRRAECRGGGPVPAQTHAALPGSAIEFKFRRLHKDTRNIGLRTSRETHLAEKTLQMRLPISNHLRNQLKKRSLQRHG
jgi:hypothetical protein